MRLDARTIFTATLLTACAPLTGCGGTEKGGNSVQMKDMEVVDGTATDAMTDLDGVQSEGTSVVVPAEKANNSTDIAAAPQNAATSKPAADDSEVLADQ